MKKIYNPLYLITFLFFSLTGLAQTLEEENAKVMNEMDLSAFEDKPVLNKGTVYEALIEPFRKENLQQDREGAVLYFMGTKHFTDLIQTLERSEMSERKIPSAISRTFNIPRTEIVKRNILPLSILMYESILLSDEQIQENISAKKEGKSPNHSGYERINMIVPGLLQDEVFQGEVEVRIGNELIMSNREDIKIEYLEIDFQDGKGWKRLEFGERTSQVQYDRRGCHRD